jgi:uncharacterized membrane protein YfcA
MVNTKDFTEKGSRSRVRRGILYSLPIGALGGLIGLGGAEFRLPVLAGPLGYSVHRAVPLNLAISFVTIAASAVVRGHRLTFYSMIPLVPVLAAFICGAAVTAFAGASLVANISGRSLERVILALLLFLGCSLIIEACLPHSSGGLLPLTLTWQVSAGALFGLAIGLVSSLLGIAGGELIIPTLVFAFGVDIITAGTASLIISLPTVFIGVARYASHGAFSDRRVFRETILPMGVGSVVGAVIGGLFLGIVSPAVLKIILGILLLMSAARTFEWNGCKTRW